MNKRIGLAWFKFLGFRGLKNIKSLSLVELMISIMAVAIMVLSFYSLETYGHQQVTSADRRAKVQSQLAYCLEHMSKYVQQANGDKNNPPIKLYPDEGTKTGFQVRFDCNSAQQSPTQQTPFDLTNDVWVYYTLSGNSLSVGCSGTCAAVPAEVLSTKIVANFNNSVLPDSPTDGFYVEVDPLGSFVDVGLVGRYDPDQVPVTAAERLANPQVEIKTRLICNNSSMN